MSTQEELRNAREKLRQAKLDLQDFHSRKQRDREQERMILEARVARLRELVDRCLVEDTYHELTTGEDSVDRAERYENDRLARAEETEGYLDP